MTRRINQSKPVVLRGYDAPPQANQEGFQPQPPSDSTNKERKKKSTRQSEDEVVKQPKKPRAGSRKAGPGK